MNTQRELDFTMASTGCTTKTNQLEMTRGQDPVSQQISKRNAQFIKMIEGNQNIDEDVFTTNELETLIRPRMHNRAHFPVQVVVPPPTTTVDDLTDFTVVPSKMKRKKSVKTHRRLPSLDSISEDAEFNSELLEPVVIDWRIKPKRKIEHHTGIFTRCNTILTAADAVEEHAEVISGFTKHMSTAKKALKYKGSSEDDFFENVLSRAEDLFSIYHVLQGCATWSAFVGAIQLYLRTWTTKPMIARLVKWMLDNFPTKLEYQGGESIAFLDYNRLKSAMSNWKAVCHSDLGKYLANLVSMIISLRFYLTGEEHLTDSPWEDQVMRLFRMKAYDVQKESLDFISMALDTMTFFLERGFEAISKGDPSVLLYGDSDLKLVDFEYAYLMSAYTLVENGRLDDLNAYMREHPNGLEPIISEYDFEYRLETLLATLTSMHKKEKSPPAKASLCAKIVALSKLRTSLIACHTKEAVRMRPFAAQIFGRSAVGKSTICNAAAKMIMSYNNYPCDERHFCTINEADQYLSEYKSSHTVVILDDLGNMKPQFYKRPPTAHIIDLVNNIPSMAVKADVESKGTVPVRPKLVLVTTNVKDMNAHVFSCEPASIQRRMDVILDVRLKPEFVDPLTGGLDSAKAGNEALPDVWDVDLLIPQIVRGNEHSKDTIRFISMGKNADGSPRLLNIYELMAHWLMPMSKKHFENQKLYVENVRNFLSSPLCEHHFPPTSCPMCKTHTDNLVFYGPPRPPLLGVGFADLKEDVPAARKGIQAINALDKLFETHGGIVVEDADDDDDSCPGAIPRSRLYESDDDDSLPDLNLCLEIDDNDPIDMFPLIEDHESDTPISEPEPETPPATEETPFAPYPTSRAWNVQEDINEALADFSYMHCTSGKELFSHAAIEDRMNRMAALQGVDLLFAAGMQNLNDAGIERFQSVPGAIPRDDSSSSASEYNEEEMFYSPEDLPPGGPWTLQRIWEEHKATIMKTTLIAGVTVGALYGALQLYRRLRSTELQSEVRVPEPMPTDHKNHWSKVEDMVLPTSLASNTTTADDLIGKIKRCIATVKVREVDDESGKVMTCNLFPLRGNAWGIPGHMLEDDKTYEITATCGKPGTVARHMRQRIDKSCWVRVKNRDLIMMRIASGGSVPNLMEFFLEKPVKPNKLFVRSVFRKLDGFIESFNGMSVGQPELVKTDSKGVKLEYEYYPYDYGAPTKKGLCMAAMITDTRRPAILGFHLAGDASPTSTYGLIGVITKPELERAYDELMGKSPFELHSAGTFPTEQYGINISVVAETPPLHPLKQLIQDEITGDDPCLEVYGAHPLGSTRFKSQIKTSPISETVTSVMELPKKHGAPSGYKIDKHLVRDFQHISHPVNNFDPEPFNAAVADIKKKFLDHMDANPVLSTMIHPYPEETILAGADGISSVDAVDLNTSVGYPLNRAKHFYLKPSLTPVNGITRPLSLDPTIKEQIDIARFKMQNRERNYFVHRANHKDESIPDGKDKIRVFAGCPFALTYLTREVYLPVIRYVQGNWIDLECAVGINAHGDDWDKLTKYLTEHGNDRVFAGDYKAFDKKMSCLIMQEAFGVLIAMCRKAGYTEEQIRICEGVATEICCPLYEAKGVYVQAFASNPSGHPLTVIINNIMNSIIMRYAYYVLHFAVGDMEPAAFAEMIRLICYGDDNASGVSPKETLFNFTNVRMVLAEVGITYTAEDKTDGGGATLTDITQITFLKRGFRYDSGLDIWMAPLDEMSISKSLHNYMARKGTPMLPLQISAMVLQGALREYFRFPKEFFELRRSQIIQVAETTGASAYVSGWLTYEDFAAMIKDGSYAVAPPRPMAEWDIEFAEIVEFSS